MKEKRELPAWAIVSAIVGALGLVGALYTMRAPGEASRDELVKIRGNQQRMSGSSSPLAPIANK